MKNIFIGQAVTGMNIDYLRRETEKITNALMKIGYIVYSTIEKEGKNTFKRKGDWVLHAFEEINKNEIFLAIVRNEHRSEGMLIEIGYSLAKKKKIILAINENVKNTYLRDFADIIIEWKNIDDLIKKIEKLKPKK